MLVERTSFGPSFDRLGYTHEVMDALERHDVGLVAMAGFMTILDKPFIDRWPGRVLNTHPSLLPAFPGAHGVRDALEAGVKVTGCTVHVATADLDAGPIVAQAAVEVRPDDTEESLHERVKVAERALYPAAIRSFMQGIHVRALLSVYDKAGIVELGRGLHDLGWELVSSSNTARALREAGLPVTEVADVTGVPEMLGHRVVTLHPNIHGGLLADLDNPDHVADLERHGITPIGLIVSNLYPFVERPDVETIDIGGPAMVRAAAKNHAHVAVVVDPADYGAVLDELRSSGVLSASTRRGLARKAFAHTSAYDAAISAWLADDTADPLPPMLALTLERAQELRYGENPHQAGARYLFRGAEELVGRRGPARRQGPLVPQPLRHRSGVAARAPARRPTGGRDREAREPVRGRDHRRHHLCVHRGQRV